MDRARWERVQELFHQALERPPGEWRGFLESCGEDWQTVEDVLAMLEESGRSDSLLDRGLPEVAFDLVGAGSDAPPVEDFGPYRLKRLLGEGGMGVVWLAERTDVGSLVAIKFLLHAGLSPQRKERFLLEMRTQARLTHPLIARLYDAGALADGAPWFVMEYVNGVPVTEYCTVHRLGLEARLRLFRAVCEAVQYAHGQATIHRDLKPSNILVLADGTPKLLDFGIARQLQALETDGEQTRPGPRFLTRAYASPEWAAAGTAGLTTDVYSLGVMLFELLTGRLPAGQVAGEGSGGREKPSDGAKVQQLIPMVSKSAWGELDVICLKAMEPDRSQRYPTVEAMIRDIDHFLRGEPLEARPAAWSYTASKFVKRNRRVLLAIGAIVLLVVGLTVAFTVRLKRARDVAEAESARTRRIQGFMLSLFQGSDPKAGPSGELRAVTLVDRGALEAQSLGAEPEVQADLYQTLGTAYQALGNLDKADKLLDAGLKVRERIKDGGPVEIADIQIARALLRSDQGRSQEAEQLAREALKTVEAQSPQDPTRIARAESALGRVLVDAGKQAEGVEVLNRAIALQAKMNGATDETGEEADTLTSLADAKMYLGHYGEVEALNQRALAINRKLYGENHPKVATNLRNLGQYEEVRDQYPIADRYERQALQINTGWYGDDHPETATAMTTLAQTLVNEGKYAEAQALLQQAIVTLRRVYGERHQRVAYALNALGNAESQLGAYKDAEDKYGEVIEIYKHNFGDGDYRVAVGMENLASVYAAERDFPRASQLIKEAIQRFIKAQGPDSVNAAKARIRLGRTLAHEGKFEEAVGNTRAGYESLVKQNSPETDFILGALEDMSILYKKVDQPEDAARFQAELARVNAIKAKPAGSK